MSKEEKSPLKELIDLDELQAIQDSFAKTVGISSVIFSPEGEPLTRFSYPTGFCSLIQSTEEGKRRCFQSFKKMSRKAIKLKKPTILYCFAHGGHFVAPIIINGEHKGTMFAGQFIPQSFSPKQLKALEKTAVEIHLDPQLLTKEAKEMCVIEEDVVEFYSSLLFQIEEFLGRLGAKAAELNRAHDALRKARDALEVRVQERTAELANSNEQLKREITERKRAEEELRESNEILSNILSASPIGIGVVTDRKLSWTNESMMKLFGVEHNEDYIGKSAEILYASEEEYERVGQIIYKNIKHKIVRVDAKLKRKDGSIFDGHIMMSFLDPSNPTKGAVATISDISWKKRAEEELREEKAFTESALNNLLDNFAIVDLEGRFIRWNKRVNEVTGYSDKEISSVNITDLFREEDTKRLLAGMERAVKGEQARDEVTLVTKDGRHIPYELFGSLIKESNGKPVGICGVGRDITGRKQAEEALRESEEKYRTLVESINDIVFTLDREGKFTCLSPRFEVATGYRPEDLIGHSFTEVLAPEYIELTVDSFRRGLSGETIPLYEVELLLRDGRRLPIELNVISILDAEGQPIGRLGVARDISERKKMEDERKRLLKELEAKKIPSLSGSPTRSLTT